MEEEAEDVNEDVEEEEEEEEEAAADKRRRRRRRRRRRPNKRHFLNFDDRLCGPCAQSLAPKISQISSIFQPLAQRRHHTYPLDPPTYLRTHSGNCNENPQWVIVIRSPSVDSTAGQTTTSAPAVTAISPISAGCSQ